MLALLERNTREFGLAHNLGEDRVREDLQELVGIERHRSITGDMSLSGRGGSFGERVYRDFHGDSLCCHKIQVNVTLEGVSLV